MIITVLLYVEMDIGKQEKPAMMEIQQEETDVLLHVLLRVDGLAVVHIQVFAHMIVLLIVLEKSVGQTTAIQEVVEVVKMLMVQIIV
jgi:hypothetical protein